MRKVSQTAYKNKFNFFRRFMRSDHLSKHIRTHNNPRATAPVRPEVIDHVVVAANLTDKMKRE
jgi:hypothetical protein